MEKFKNVLKRRIAFMLAFNGLAIAFIILSIYIARLKSHNGSEMDGFVSGFQIGIYFGLQIVIIIYVIKYLKALKSDIELKKLYIKENDEREKVIRDKIGGVGLDFSLAVIATAAVISGFFNQTVFMTLLAVLVAVVAIKGTLKIYYRRKF
jgi:hypothetical protein